MPPENVRYPPDRRSRNYIKNTLPKCYDVPPKPSQIKETMANKNGLRRYYLSGKEIHRGFWKDNEKHGLGKQFNKETGETYEGEFHHDKRSFYGVISRRKPNGTQEIIYEGDFANGSPNGEGELHSDTYHYKGKVYNGKASGVGIAWFNNGTIYFGTWFKGKRMGVGMLIHKNRNRYEGNWYNDKKHGPGEYCFFDRGQALEGVWVADVCIRGTVRNIKYRQAATEPVMLPLPELKLKDWADCYYHWREEALACVGKYVRKDLEIDDLKKKDSKSCTDKELNFPMKKNKKYHLVYETDLVNLIARSKISSSIVQVQPCVVFE